MAKVGRCQSVLIGEKLYYYGEIIPYLCWKLDDGTENEIWDAKIVAVSGMRENNISLNGKDHNGNLISATIDMDNIID